MSRRKRRGLGNEDYSVDNDCVMREGGKKQEKRRESD